MSRVDDAISVGFGEVISTTRIEDLDKRRSQQGT